MTETKTISIRDIPKDLWWEIKSLAARRRVTIRDLIIDLLRQAVQKEGE